MKQAQRKIEKQGLTAKTGTGGVKVSPYFQIETKAREQVRAFCAEFGFTPSSRGRIEVPPIDETDEDFKRFFN